MNLNSIALAITLALIMGSWPIFGKFAGATAAGTFLVVNVGTITTGTILFGNRLVSEPCTNRTWAILLTVGIVNGIACYFSVKECLKVTVNTGLFLTVIAVASCVFGPVINLVLNHETLTLKQVCGICLAGLSIWLLKK
jgi:hypothetical protein